MPQRTVVVGTTDWLSALAAQGVHIASTRSYAGVIINPVGIFLPQSNATVDGLRLLPANDDLDDLFDASLEDFEAWQAEHTTRSDA